MDSTEKKYYKRWREVKDENSSVDDFLFLLSTAEWHQLIDDILLDNYSPLIYIFPVPKGDDLLNILTYIKKACKTSFQVKNRVSIVINGKLRGHGSEKSINEGVLRKIFHFIRYVDLKIDNKSITVLIEIITTRERCDIQTRLLASLVLNNNHHEHDFSLVKQFWDRLFRLAISEDTELLKPYMSFYNKVVDNYIAKNNIDAAYSILWGLVEIRNSHKEISTINIQLQEFLLKMAQKLNPPLRSASVAINLRTDIASISDKKKI